MAPTRQWQIAGLETGQWTVVEGPSINPVNPDSFVVEPVAKGVQIFCAGPKYSGALAKQVNALPWQTAQITFTFTVDFDGSIVYAQVLETDSKITDSQGYTYDGSLQFNLAEGWMIQVGDPWVDTGVKMPLRPGDQVKILYRLDFVAHTMTIVSVNGQALNLQPLAAKKVGWAPGEIVTQLQLCIASQAGAYTATFEGIAYEGQ